MESGAPKSWITADSLGFSFKNSQISYSVNNPSDNEFGASVGSFVGGGIKGSGGGGVQAEISMRNNKMRFMTAKNTTLRDILQLPERLKTDLHYLYTSDFTTDPNTPYPPSTVFTISL